MIVVNIVTVIACVLAIVCLNTADDFNHQTVISEYIGKATRLIVFIAAMNVVAITIWITSKLCQ